MKTARAHHRSPSLLSRRRRWLTYAVLGGLWATGTAWLVLRYGMQRAGEFGPAPHPLQPWALRAHALFAFATLWLGGLLWAVAYRTDVAARTSARQRHPHRRIASAARRERISPLLHRRRSLADFGVNAALGDRAHRNRAVSDSPAARSTLARARAEIAPMFRSVLRAVAVNHRFRRAAATPIVGRPCRLAHSIPHRLPRMGAPHWGCAHANHRVEFEVAAVAREGRGRVPCNRRRYGRSRAAWHRPG